MKNEFLNTVSPLEVILFVIFVVYIVFSVPTPSWLASMINSNFGMGIIFIMTLYMFLFTTPILGILSIFVAYELLRRSSVVSTETSSIIQYTPTQIEKDEYIVKLNPLKVETLEEEVVANMAPVGVSDSTVYIETDYKPIADKVMGGSLVV
jgi:uncharacterized membrane protein (DUF485 family)